MFKRAVNSKTRTSSQMRSQRRHIIDDITSSSDQVDQLSEPIQTFSVPGVRSSRMVLGSTKWDELVLQELEPGCSIIILNFKGYRSELRTYSIELYRVQILTTRHLAVHLSNLIGDLACRSRFLIIINHLNLVRSPFIVSVSIIQIVYFEKFYLVVQPVQTQGFKVSGFRCRFA